MGISFVGVWGVNLVSEKKINFTKPKFHPKGTLNICAIFHSSPISS